ncbi:dipeptidyl-peptidase 6 [Clostridium puniceum]|uniref:Dipeptidyl-peptidase 6 n=1 Tax=Clostridium puniceum TaxID=29367 RepID=A0A1S8TCP9_9CLOT|nr:SH3 domain-containing C40 family peptidase [Clostridium puniceum]OOM75381.1 dipeptidyl-peptidase 6 [Clostridium puniceum]
MKYAVVNKAIGVLKSEPKEVSESTDEVLFGMNVEILRESENNWLYVRTHYNYEGYINGDSLIINDEISKEWEKEKNVVVINYFADVLNKPQASGYEIVNLTRGANLISTVEISGNKRFIKVKLPNLEFGWIRKSFISKLKVDYDIKNENNIRENLAKSALSYLGTQYRWGGKSPLGIDCSGLCSMAYMLNGILIYRDANIKKGFPIKEIPFKKIKKGDLIFFPEHVAMYLDNGNYVHSSTSNDVVKINSLNKNAENYNEYLGKCTKRFGSIF